MAPSEVVIDATTRAEIVQSLSEKLKATYVFPDIAEQIGICLQKHMKDGEYNDITEGELLAAILATHIQEINHDKHLLVRYYPEELPDQEGALVQNQAWQDEWRQQARLDNYGLHRAERLPGNVGYLDIRAFNNAAWGGDTAAAAMTFLASTTVLIIDLRKCRGGDPDMVALISSYLFGEEHVHLNSLHWRDGDFTEQYWTLPYVPGKKFGDKPVYVLTSKDTFSGGEEFAYNLKTRQRATLIGETTGGGAHPGTAYRLHPHFDVFIPNGRAVNPITGSNWEGTGVTPDIPINQEQAFTVAYGMALKAVIENPGEAPSRPVIALKDEAEAALKDLEIT